VKATDLHIYLFKHTPNISHAELINNKNEKKNISICSPGWSLVSPRDKDHLGIAVLEEECNVL
jgi:hypothetical protein